MTRKTLSALFFVLTIGVAVNAQQPAAGAAARPAAGATTAAAPGPVKIGVIYTEAFSDPKTGINRLTNAAQTLEREFQPRSTAIRTDQQNLEKLATQISATTSVADPAALQRLRDQAESLQLGIQRKQQDAQRDYERRAGEVLSPIQTNINQALVQFARQRGFSMLMNASQLNGVVIPLDATMDITREFIAEYNRTNPATAAATTRP